MSRTESTPARRRTALLLALAVVTTLVVVAGLLLRQYAPGNMGNGFLAGALVASVGASLAVWRSTTRPQAATTIERAFTQTGDERDDAVLTRALAVLGVCAVPLTGVAAIAIALDASYAVVMALLLFGQLAIGVTAFVVINRRS